MRRVKRMTTYNAIRYAFRAVLCDLLAPFLKGPAIQHFDVKTLKCYFSDMSTNPKRATVYFDPELHRALRVKAAETERSMSDLVNEAVQLSLAEDAADLAAFRDRVNEPNLPYEDVVKDLKRRGKI